MKVSEVLNELDAIQVYGNAESRRIGSITNDSRELKKNAVFVAVKGLKSDGHKYVEEAINKGAAAVILEDDNAVPDEMFNAFNCIKILVENSRKALAQLATSYYGRPSEKLKLIGITGTKGKTTTTYYLKNLLESMGYKTGLLGTIANYNGKDKIDSKLTTPESHHINKMLFEMVNNGCEYCVMEVSSHALDLQRVFVLDFAYTIFTNITSDHLDYHKDFETYFKAKKILFDGLKSDSDVILNSDDKSAERIVCDSAARINRFGSAEGGLFELKDVNYDLDGTRFTIGFESNRYMFNTPLIGKFNAYNAGMAAAIGFLEGFDPEKIIDGINNTPQVPGRFEVVKEGEKKVIIDYSHTSDSLRQALEAIKHVNTERRPVYTVFGCGGDRDKTKRPIMGEIADSLSDEIIVTSDNPRTENPNMIIADILKGIKRENPTVIESREEAIKKAVTESESNAVILIAGKGHETYQEINGIRNHFSDKETAEKYLRQ